jgi:aminoglycoside 6'-N-acetyltransferase I
MNAATLVIRDIEPSDADQWLTLRCQLWPGHDEDHAEEIKAFFAGTAAEPQAVLVAQDGPTMVGFAELTIRTDIPDLVGRKVGYVEGLYVTPSYRATNVIRKLLQASQWWAHRSSCVAFASDRADWIIIDRRFSTRTA